ncbi:hypothetical protein J3F84DRAFT_124772 [Trichoderma pleuroticola]
MKRREAGSSQRPCNKMRSVSFVSDVESLAEAPSSRTTLGTICSEPRTPRRPVPLFDGREDVKGFKAERRSTCTSPVLDMHVLTPAGLGLSLPVPSAGAASRRALYITRLAMIQVWARQKSTSSESMALLRAIVPCYGRQSPVRSEARERLLKGGGATHYSGRAAASGRVADWMQKVTYLHMSCRRSCCHQGRDSQADGFQYPVVLVRNLDMSAARKWLHKQRNEPCPSTAFVAMAVPGCLLALAESQDHPRRGKGET